MASNILLGILLVFILNYKVTDVMEVDLLDRGQGIAKNIAGFYANQIKSNDKTKLNEIINLSAYHGSVEYIIIQDSDWNLIADTYKGKVPAEIVKKIDKNKDILNTEIIKIPFLNIECYDIIEPVDKGEQGFVRVGINKNYIESRIASVVDPIIITILFITVIGIIIAYFLTNIIIQPILYLTKRANEVSVGKLDEKITVATNDEIKYLAEAVERLRESLVMALSRLKKHQTLRS